MATAEVVNVSALIDRKVSGYQWWLFAICFLISLIDGLDSQIMSVTGPMIARGLKLSPGALGPLLSASQWGALIGAFGIGFFSDRWGRRRMLLVCGLLFSTATLATAWAESFSTLLTLRIVTGLGIGGAVPCYLALAAEYAPERNRAGVVAVVLGAVPCGGILAGLLGAGLLSSFDWQTVYKVCGALSLLISLLLYASLPESLSFMITRGFDVDKIRAVLQKLAPNRGYEATTRFVINEEIKRDAPVRHLFTERRAPMTGLLWIAFFINYLVLVGTLVWTPMLLKQAGMSIAEGSLALTFNNIGGIIGIVVAGQLFDRFRSSLFWLLSGMFLGGALATALIGYSVPSFIEVCIMSTLAGLLIPAGLSGLYGVSALIYPTFMRSTGIGWSSGFGRVGSSMGPVLVGLMFAAGWSTPLTTLSLGLIALANVVCVWLMSILIKRRSAAAAASPAE
ncbi:MULTISPECIES: MFS transporter [unclassified Bradyrhizobium]|uniref:MFS transporter n=1 Tax=unclassified Bradyrhizobium TaxID=2631580 RepID=UPI002478DD39|nr:MULTISPECIES: MFS transporter [unclassified Bradyrhizobium]WGR73146.1 MFS transporter [Bradyrhizobium sp. ISRA426]WGR77986.1 MFS transporter [Bradyrhizobium sp. ISRA430]WGR88387.1 MFS transporter [Bradyrhizobium sp. ISRA432]